MLLPEISPEDSPASHAYLENLSPGIRAQVSLIRGLNCNRSQRVESVIGLENRIASLESGVEVANAAIERIKKILEKEDSSRKNVESRLKDAAMMFPEAWIALYTESRIAHLLDETNSIEYEEDSLKNKEQLVRLAFMRSIAILEKKARELERVVGYHLGNEDSTAITLSDKSKQKQGMDLKEKAQQLTETVLDLERKIFQLEKDDRGLKEDHWRLLKENEDVTALKDSFMKKSIKVEEDLLKEKQMLRDQNAELEETKKALLQLEHKNCLLEKDNRGLKETTVILKEQHRHLVREHEDVTALKDKSLKMEEEMRVNNAKLVEAQKGLWHLKQKYCQLDKENEGLKMITSLLKEEQSVLVAENESLRKTENKYTKLTIKIDDDLLNESQVFRSNLQDEDIQKKAKKKLLGTMKLIMMPKGMLTGDELGSLMGSFVALTAYIVTLANKDIKIIALSGLATLFSLILATCFNNLVKELSAVEPVTQNSYYAIKLLNSVPWIVLGGIVPILVGGIIPSWRFRAIVTGLAMLVLQIIFACFWTSRFKLPKKRGFWLVVLTILGIALSAGAPEVIEKLGG